MPESTKELSGPDLDRAIAERVFGWERVEGQTALAPFAYRRPDGHIVHPYSAPSYSSSIRAAMEVEDRIAGLGKQGDYIAALWDVMGADRGVNFWTASNIEAFWLCIHATAEQRCRAALAAIGDQQK